MNSVVVRINGKQHLVAAGDKLTVDRLEGEVKDKLVFKDVLLKIDGDKVTIGTPLVSNSAVETEVVKQFKGEKIRVAKFKAKSRFRKVKGHRQHLTELKIVKI